MYIYIYSKERPCKQASCRNHTHNINMTSLVMESATATAQALCHVLGSHNPNKPKDIKHYAIASELCGSGILDG